MEDIGPVEYMIVSFPGNRFTGEIAPALAELVESNGSSPDMISIARAASSTFRARGPI